jgi:hypothetical protein
MAARDAVLGAGKHRAAAGRGVGTPLRPQPVDNFSARHTGNL